ncbi:MAG: radical SAM protein [Halobacteriota archaeon]
MARKVLIIVPPVRLSQTPSRFPLGLAYVAASLERCGIEVSILDLNILRLPKEAEELKVSEAIQTVDVVCTGGMITTLNTIARIASYVKKYRPQIPVVVGGPLASNFEEMILRNTQIDILVKGEGEEVASKLISALPDKNLLQKIDGLAFLSDGEFCLTSPPRRIQNLDLLPMPAYRLFPFETYIQNRGAPRSADIIASRGCPYNCSFCFRNFGRQAMVRSVENVISEIRFLKDIYQIEHIYLEDEVFGLNKEYLKKFCSEIRKLGGITWGASTRVDALTLELLKEMKASGCKMLMVGIESFSDDRLKEMNKKIRVEQMDKVCHWMNQVGVEISPGFIIGMPGETEESIQKTVDGCIRHRIPITKWIYAFATPYPGTKLYSDAKEAGIIKDNWECIQRLCEVGDTCDLAINLTKFSDKELIQMRDNAIKVVTRHLRPPLSKRGEQFFRKIVIGGYKRLQSVETKAKRLLGFDVTPFNCVYRDHFRENLDENEAKKLFNETVQMVEIEVFSFCNRKCWFCSNAIIDRHSQNIRMSEGIYHKIISNLKEINYANRISYSRYNEPLADRIILDRLCEAREALPHATLHISTNGDYLKKDYLRELYDAGLRSLNIQVYLPESFEYTDELAAKYLVSTIKHYALPYRFVFKKPVDWLEYRLEFRDMDIRLYARNFKVNGTDRGGIVAHLKIDEIRESPCLIPFHDMYIDYNGKVVPCCNIRSDWPGHSKFILGDLNEQRETLFSIFTSSKIVAWRRALINYGKKNGACNSCKFEEIPPTAANIRKSKRKSKYAKNK